MDKWYQKDNGQTTIYGDEADVSRNWPEAKEIPSRPDVGYLWQNGQWVLDSNDYLQKRAVEYPDVQELFIAIAEQFSMIKAKDPSALSVSMNDFVSKYDAVNSKHPNPNIKS